MSKLCRLRRSEGYEARDDEEQDKRVASYAAPLPTSARSAGSLRGTRVGSQIQKKPQIEVAQGLYPPVSRHWDDVFGLKRRDFDGQQK